MYSSVGAPPPDTPTPPSQSLGIKTVLELHHVINERNQMTVHITQQVAFSVNGYILQLLRQGSHNCVNYVFSSCVGIVEGGGGGGAMATCSGLCLGWG